MIAQAHSPSEIETARQLFREYSDWLQVDLCFQNFEKELAGLPGDYAPPEGRLWLAWINQDIAGCIALRSLGEGICEMKRLYVRPEFRGQGLGRLLAEKLIQEARNIGYQKMRLDTLPGRMDQAIAMYRDLGFQEIERYYNNPDETALFMELDL
ncbi:MAG TPA: GNAT family N-acetyltransferase [Pyrinomonadaceae bacterium]|nr:GNAT family N-acetyltransferase [Pyrinomonadaceae bacterium]